MTRDEAKRQGLVRYDSDTPCRQCGEKQPERYVTNNLCLACKYDRARKLISATKRIYPDEQTPTTKEAALVMGSKYYFPGIRCKHGHLSKRRTANGACLKCVAVTQRGHYQRNGLARVVVYVDHASVAALKRYAEALTACALLDAPDNHPLMAHLRGKAV